MERRQKRISSLSEKRRSLLATRSGSLSPPSSARYWSRLRRCLPSLPSTQATTTSMASVSPPASFEDGAGLRGRPFTWLDVTGWRRSPQGVARCRQGLGHRCRLQGSKGSYERVALRAQSCEIFLVSRFDVCQRPG